MTVFDKLREKNRFLALMVKFQNSALYPALFALICIFSGTGDSSVYIPCIYAITLLSVLAGLFSDDLKVFILPAFMGYYFVGMDSAEGYFAATTAGFPPLASSSIPHLAICIAIILAVLIYRMTVTGLAREALTQRGVLFWGVLALAVSLALNGILSPAWNIYTLLFGLMLGAIFLLFYPIFLTILSHSANGISYACKCLVFMGYAVVAQIAIVAYRLHTDGLLFGVYPSGTFLNRDLLSLTWGGATIIGAVIVLAIVAALYLMKDGRYPALSFASAVIFWISTVLIDTRSAIIFGAIALAFGCVLCCIRGRNRVFNRFVTLGSVGAAIAALAVVIIAFPETYKHIFERVLDYLRFDTDRDGVSGFFSGRLTLWWNGILDFLSAPIFGKGFAEGYIPPEEDIANYFSRMYHNAVIQIPASLGIVGLAAFILHVKHVVEITARRFSVEKLLVLLMPFCIFGMSLVDNFFFYPNFIIVYTAFLAAAEVTLERSRLARLNNLKTIPKDRKPRVVFPFVEAGKGHIIPTQNICDEFKKRYGDRCEVIESRFFTETGDPDLEKTEVLFRKAVQNQNRSPVLSFLCKLGNLIAGDNFALFVLLRTTRSGVKTNPRAVKHVEELDADVIYSAHWSIPFYVNQLHTPRPYTICFCPDVYSNGAFNVDCNNFLISSDVGYAQVKRFRLYAGGNITQIPFPMRPAAEHYKDPAVRAQCREALSIPSDEFVIALCDGGYGMARLEKTVKHLLRASEPMTVIALCGTNHELYLKLEEQSHHTPAHIRLIAVDFTDRVLDYLACADVFAGKSGANAIAEPASLGIPIVVTKCITYVERGIKNYYVRYLKGAIYIPSSRLAARRLRRFAADPSLLATMRDNLNNTKRQTYDAGASADLIWQRVQEMQERS